MQKCRRARFPNHHPILILGIGTHPLPCISLCKGSELTGVVRWPGCIHVSALRSFLGNPLSGGGPEDLRVVADIKAFVGRHVDKFVFDTTTKRVSSRLFLIN